ncbi:MAG: tRNA pseudouridine(38-40) synthase TruA [Deltaproteobacteria bacterium]|nr:tRNA pseudouridine(38-40) synthase TruA [Deltaproteobacteria bacterium]
MRNIKFIIEYEGTNYAGWQIQENLPTIQGTIQEKLKIMTGGGIELTAASRTDAGVHALGQAVNFRTESRISPHSFQMGLNALLPHDIVIKDAEEVPPDFDSRRNAKAKTYRYFILNRPYPSAIYKNFCWHVFQRLDIDAMKAAANLLVGKKDFTSFRAAECDALHSLREILSFSIETTPSIPPLLKGDEMGVIELEVRGTAFLRHMVRIMTGTLVAVGKGKIKLNDFQAVIDAQDRRLAGMTAPPQGLFLKEVEY